MLILLISKAKSTEGRRLNGRKRERLDEVKRRTRAKIKSARGEVKGTNQLLALQVCSNWRTAAFWGSDANLTLLKTCVPTGQTAWRDAYHLFYLGETHHFTFTLRLFIFPNLAPPLVARGFFWSFFPSFCSYFPTKMCGCKCIQTLPIIRNSVKTPHITDSQSICQIV